ncbi:MAG TPA: mannonate dehydratase [Oceanospirillaceae bacterium]|nr:mannonate dehydratase [Oceanospirillaceae bacterium]
MEATWRWFGPSDPVTLTHIKQTGATGIVSALHDIGNGEIWSVARIAQHKALIESHGLNWSVVESIPVHEDIKTRTGNYQTWIDNYKVSLVNLASQGITTVCYNFMPVLDWTRTDLAYTLPDGTKALRFDQTAFAAFELYILKRPNAATTYSVADQSAAQTYYQQLNDLQIQQLTANIIAGLPGAEGGYTLNQFQQQLDRYQDIDAKQLRHHLKLFLLDIIPTCEQHGLRLAIHPDDPPRPILGLPRVVSTNDDMAWLADHVPSAHNGFTMCTGSYGVRADNQLVDMINTHKARIYFAHLRSTVRDQTDPNSFHEASHLQGDIDMVQVIQALLQAEQHQQQHGIAYAIPMRPDHGHQMLDDLDKQTNPGYSCIGRMKGLAEIRGIELALQTLSKTD